MSERAIVHTPIASKNRLMAILLAALLLVALLWSYAPTLRGLVRDWRSDDNYSVGQLVPLAALYLLWVDRRKLAGVRVAPCWWGIGVMLLAECVHLFGLIALFESAERYAMVLSVVGITLLVGGRGLLRQVVWVLLFLFLMVPLPGRVHNAISGPLQELASRGAVATLELLGLTVAREGNVLVLNNQVSVAVAEACSGLRMLTAFVVVAAVFACLARRPPWQKVVLLLSSLPVAILCNLLRLVVTALLYLVISGELAERFFHDFAGWTMMPLAILILLGELWIMARLTYEESHGPTQTPL